MVVFSLGWAATATAQIVNVQQLAGKPVQPGLSGQVSVGGDWLLGNSQLLTGAGNASVFVRGEHGMVLATVSGAYGVKGTGASYADEPFQAKVFEHLRLRRGLAQGWSFEAFAQHEYDRWRRLKTRIVAGGGVRLDVDAMQGVHVALGLAHLSQWEELLKPRAGDLSGLVSEQRLSSYLVAAAEVSATASALVTLYAQPRWADWADLRGLVDVALVVTVSKATALRVNWVLGYDTRPPAGVRGYDGTGKISFVAGF
ncbi:MAG: DUF481 domain-containing protein [Deltaproteobacteria bacterium]|nr:DUF481 domain-containing protein [Deltaproteobacteria bacterium]